MSLQRFKQIRSAFHPNLGASDIQDKCHQLQYSINTITAISRTIFIPGLDLSVDKGGVMSCSYLILLDNTTKTNQISLEFRVDCFVLADNSKVNYFVTHIDAYQGKNTENIVPQKIYRGNTNNAECYGKCHSSIQNEEGRPWHMSAIHR